MGDKCKACNANENVFPALGYCTDCLNNMVANQKSNTISNKAQTQRNHKKQKADGRRTNPRDHDYSSDDDDDIEDNYWLLKGSDSNSSNHHHQNDIREVQVDKEFEKYLKPYQREGVEFLWRNSFSDFNLYEGGDQNKIGGCILAHYMGLGKSLTTITLLHTALTCPTMMSSSNGKPLVYTVLLVAPANTLTNWVNEVEKWTTDLDKPLKVINLGEIQPGSRSKNIKKWKREGGLLVMGDALFLKMAKEIVKSAQPDVLVLDEAHTMLKCSANKGFKMLQEMKTKRRLLLTGTPLQNNVSEYYRMVEFIRPGVVGVSSESEFETVYRTPIEAGLPSDASDADKLKSLRLQLELKNKLEPHVNRKSANVLRQQLPPIYDTLLYLHPSTIQTRLMKLDRRARKTGEKTNNFFSMYAHIAPMLNHPGCLKMIRGKRGKGLSWKSSDDAGDEWFMTGDRRLNEKEFKSMHEGKNSPKLIMIAHILAFAQKLGANGEKTLIYSKDLNTLDIVEWFLNCGDWKRHVSSLKEPFKEKLGGWEKGKDYLRIDGSVDSGRRGELIERFNEEEAIKAFLISSLAGGIGINLCAAAVVVIMDNHFNPSVSDQCVSRAHRLGQDKPVYVFRLAIVDTMEAKIYARSVNKSGVAMQVVDGKFSERLFSADQLNDLKEATITATCDLCKKRRLLHPLQEPPEEDEEWNCTMNDDKKYNSCNIPEQPELQKRGKERENMANNAILRHLLGVINYVTRRTEIVHDYLPVEITHEADICCEDAIRKLEAEMRGQKKKAKKSKARQPVIGKSMIPTATGQVPEASGQTRAAGCSLAHIGQAPAAGGQPSATCIRTEAKVPAIVGDTKTPPMQGRPGSMQGHPIVLDLSTSDSESENEPKRRRLTSV